MTQSQIANILNISRSTVSLALAGSEKVNRKTRKRVCELADKVNYQPNIAARSLVTRKSNMIGVILPAFSHRFYAELSDEIAYQLNQKGYSAIFKSCFKYNTYAEMFDAVMSRNVDGIISYMIDHCQYVKLLEKRIPVVLYRNPGNFPLSYVDVDRRIGGELLTKHLLNKGRKRIAFIGEAILNIQNCRYIGYQQTLLENGIMVDDSLVVNHIGEMKAGIEGVDMLFKQIMAQETAIPDAIIFHNDSMAVSGMEELKRRGFSIPDDISITGFDNIEESAYTFPRLTTVDQPKTLIAEQLVNILIDRIVAENSIEAKKYIFEPQLIEREST